MLPKPTIPNKARLLLNELRADDVELTDSEVVWIYQLGANVHTPPVSGNADLIGMGHNLGHLLFYPLTLGARLWVYDYGLQAIPANNPKSAYVFAFASVHSKCPEVLNGLQDPSRIFDVVLDWAKNELGQYFPEQLEQALAKIFPEDPFSIPDPDAEKCDQGFSLAISRMCDEVGGTPEQWVWEYPFSVVMDQISYIGMKDAAQSQGGTPGTDPSLQALKALMYAGDLIRVERGLEPKYLPERIASA